MCMHIDTYTLANIYINLETKSIGVSCREIEDLGHPVLYQSYLTSVCAYTCHACACERETVCVNKSMRERERESEREKPGRTS